MSGKPNLNFPILSFETCFNLLPDAQPSFESNPPSQWHTFLFVQTWRNNECTSNTTWKSCKKKVFLHSTWGKKRAFTLLVVVFQQLWLVQFDPCCLTQWFAPSAVRCPRSDFDGRLRTLIVCFIIGQVLILSGVLLTKN